jgi:predicted DNA-binding protein (MmcQ/YjbR family)
VIGVPLRLPGSVLTHPFGEDVNVYKVGITTASGLEARHSAGKIYALIGLRNEPDLLTLKVEPERGVTLVAEHGAIAPGYHMNKRHWISVTLDGSVEDDLVRELLEDAYDLTLSTLTARARFDVDPDRFPLPASRTARPSRG